MDAGESKKAEVLFISSLHQSFKISGTSISHMQTHSRLTALCINVTGMIFAFADICPVHFGDTWRRTSTFQMTRPTNM